MYEDPLSVVCPEVSTKMKATVDRYTSAPISPSIWSLSENEVEIVKIDNNYNIYNY